MRLGCCLGSIIGFILGSIVVGSMVVISTRHDYASLVWVARTGLVFVALIVLTHFKKNWRPIRSGMILGAMISPVMIPVFFFGIFALIFGVLSWAS